MLTQLLPGLRNVRAPLISGVLILFSCVLLLRSSLVSVSHQSGRSTALNQFIHWIGRPGLITAALLASYLIGSMAVTVVRFLIEQGLYSNAIGRFWQTYGFAFQNWVKRRDEDYHLVGILSGYRRGLVVRWTEPRRVIWNPPRFFPFSYEALVSLLDELNRRTMLLGFTNFDPGQGAFLQELFQQMLDGKGRRLVVANQDLYQEFDRQQSEAELRDSLLIPLPLAYVAVVLNTHLSVVTELIGGAVIVLVVILMFLQGRSYDRAAWSLYASAVADHVISTPLLDTQGWQDPLPKPETSNGPLDTVPLPEAGTSSSDARRDGS